MDAIPFVPALAKLGDYCASGIGSVAGSVLAPWKAGRQAKANRIAAKGEVEVRKILAEGQAETMQIIADAQAEARAKLLTPDASIHGELSFTETVSQRIQFQEEKRQANIASVIGQAVLQLEDKEVQDHEVDHDWTARFFNDVQDVSSEEMQKLWARVLAGEVERPGGTSIKTLDNLKNLDKATAHLFQLLCSICVSVTTDGTNFVDARVPSLGGNAGNNSLKEYGLGFDQLNKLNEHGLIISDYNSWYDIKLSIGVPLDNNQLLYIPIRFQNRYWILISKVQRKPAEEFRLSGVALTKSGEELSKIVDLQPMHQFKQNLLAFFAKSNLNMVEVGGWLPQVFPNFNA